MTTSGKFDASFPRNLGLCCEPFLATWTIRRSDPCLLFSDLGVERMASLILARGLVPDARERRRLVGLDLDDALGGDHRDDVVGEEQA